MRYVRFAPILFCCIIVLGAPPLPHTTATLSFLDFYKNFFLIFYFSFLRPVTHGDNADIAHLFALQSLKILFMYN